MNREIKFRAWVKSYEDSDGEMLEMPLHLPHFDYGQGWVVALTDYQGFYAHECYENRKPHEFHLMQYTGLRDKNGKEIYEGDLLRYQTSPIYKVVFDSSAWKGAARSPEGGWFTLNLHDRTNIFEVIGNIHDNPDLLQE